MNLGLENRCFLVAGASRGIGHGIAGALLAEGARVCLTGRDGESLGRAQATFAALHGDRVCAERCDFTDPSSLRALIEKVGSRWPKLDGFIWNAGSGRSVPDAIPPADHWAKVQRHNFDAAVEAARAFLPLLVSARGTLLFIASIAGLEAFGAPVDYSTAKAALIAFSKNLSRKLGSQGVRVNTLAPGNVAFPGGDWDRKRAEDPAKVEAMLKASVPLGRFGTPEEIGAAAAFLVSPRADFITGACLVVDGGQTVGLF
ncbi:MAG: SDR family oxidoreductase [Spirochaetes bacterium]|nr:SDR family oxidoreductase [Spirochaetota bacterium]